MRKPLCDGGAGNRSKPSDNLRMQTPAAHNVFPAAVQGVDHYENFPVASWLTPARLRPAIVAIYWFARTADDIADEGDATAAERLADLAAFRADLLICSNSDTASLRWPLVFAPLRQAILEHALPVPLLDALLQAFEQDVRYTAASRWYASNSELLDYCNRSANPVGRLLLHLYGVTGERELAASDAICSALQLINFWQDLSKDIPRGRYYLALNAIAANQVLPADLLAQQDTSNTIKMIANYVDFSSAILRKGFELPGWVRQQIKGFDGWRLSMELRCVIQGGLRIAEKIKALDHRTLSQRPKLDKWDALLIAWRALRM
jgi:hydroxysqualene synthase